MNRTVLLLVGVGIIVLGIFAVFAVPTKNNPQPIVATQALTPTVTPKNVDFTASFGIYTNGTFRVFTASMYHNLSKDVFIKADNPNRVYVKKAGVTWDDFFKTLPMKLTKDCLTTGTRQTFCTDNNGRLRFYLNGKEDNNALGKQIENGDRLLISYGNENEDQIQKQLQKIPSLK